MAHASGGTLSFLGHLRSCDSGFLAPLMNRGPSHALSFPKPPKNHTPSFPKPPKNHTPSFPKPPKAHVSGGVAALDSLETSS